MLLEMYGESGSRASSVLGKFDYDDMLQEDESLFSPSLLEPSEGEATAPVPTTKKSPTKKTKGESSGKGARGKGKRGPTTSDSKGSKKQKKG